MLVFEEGGKPENPEKTPRSKGENQQQTQSTYDAGSGNRTRDTLVVGECSHHCTNRAPHVTCFLQVSKGSQISIESFAIFLIPLVDTRCGSRGGEIGEFSNPPPPPFSESPSFFFSYPLNIEIIFDFSDIITKIHLPFQNPGSALGCVSKQGQLQPRCHSEARSLSQQL